ncbi:hypothetical protein NPN13_25380, partial [Vibrio parahaemolyticus]|nr:hypothetical protein [Vibrio parahaemolyticus]
PCEDYIYETNNSHHWQTNEIEMHMIFVSGTEGKKMGFLWKEKYEPSSLNQKPVLAKQKF